MDYLTYEQIESLISRNSRSVFFRTEQETEATFKNLDLFEYLIRKNPATFVAFDLETTGVNSVDDSIIEIGAVRVINGNVADTYHQLVNPMRSVPASASKVNHITDDMLVNEPYIFQILPDFLGFVGPYPLIAHNALFDARFITQACLRYRFKYPRIYFDSMKLDKFWPDLPNRKLTTMLSAAGIKCEDCHRALSDAEAVANLMLVSLNKKAYLDVPPEYDFKYSIDHFTGTVEKTDDRLSGLRFVITGYVDGYERLDLEKLISSHGGKATVKISSATDFLVEGSFPGLPDQYITAKVKYAQDLIKSGGKIQIITPVQLFEMMGESL